MSISNATKDLIKAQIEQLKVEKARIESEMKVLKDRRDEILSKRDLINDKINKFQNDLLL